jgi:hypothetical protein
MRLSVFFKIHMFNDTCDCLHYYVRSYTYAECTCEALVHLPAIELLAKLVDGAILRVLKWWRTKSDLQTCVRLAASRRTSRLKQKYFPDERIDITMSDNNMTHAQQCLVHTFQYVK